MNDTTSKVIGDAKTSDKIQVSKGSDGSYKKGNWYNVVWKGEGGWIRAQDAVEEAAPAAAAAAPVVASQGTGKTGTYTYVTRYDNTVTKDWTISDEEFLDSNSLTQEQITAICNKNNSELVERGFDKAIYEFAKNKGINPKVLLATLAQEQGWCRSGNYKSAFGVGPGGNPLDFAEGDKGGMAISVNTFLKWFNKGVELEKSGNLEAMLVNHDPSPYPETKAVFGSKTKEWQNDHPSDVKFMENGQNVTPVNAAMYAKLKYTPWVDFPAQGSHPLDDWHNIFRSFK